MNSPYRNTMGSDYYNAKHVQIRWRKTLAFLNEDKTTKSALDIGDRTPFTEKLESFFDCPFDNTKIDLDKEHLTGEYDVITACEIIEHLYNPLHFLMEIRSVLNKSGTLYLSTPKGKPYFLWSEDHFHEMRFDRLNSLINRAGFSIIRYDEIHIHPLSFYFTGIRPLLRFVFEKHLLLELKLRNI